MATNASGLASQVCSCLCLFMMFNAAKSRAFTPPMMLLTCLLCLCSTSSTWNIVNEIAMMAGVNIPSPI